MDFGSGLIGNWAANGSYRDSDARLAEVRDSGGFVAFGDSILFNCRSALKAKFEARGVDVAFDAWPGRPTPPAVDALAGMITRGLRPPRLLMMTGANDVFAPLDFAGQVDRVMELAGAVAPVFWMTSYVDRWSLPAKRTEDAANTATINAALHEAAGQYPNLQLIDWHWVLREKPGPTHPPAYPSITTLPRPCAYLGDGVHPKSPGGVAFLVAWIDQGIDWAWVG